MNGIIEAGTILVGVDATGAGALRYDAAMRVDNGMIAQIGAIEAVAYGNDQLPRFGSPKMVALPAFVRGSVRLEPGRQADLVGLFAIPPEGLRGYLKALVDRGEGDASLTLMIGGQLWINQGAILALDRDALNAYLASPPTPEEIAVWDAACLVQTNKVQAAL